MILKKSFLKNAWSRLALASANHDQAFCSKLFVKSILIMVIPSPNGKRTVGCLILLYLLSVRGTHVNIVNVEMYIVSLFQ